MAIAELSPVPNPTLELQFPQVFPRLESRMQNSHKHARTNAFPFLITCSSCWVVFQIVESKLPVGEVFPKHYLLELLKGGLAVANTTTFPNINESELLQTFPLRFHWLLSLEWFDMFIRSGYRRKTIHRSTQSALASHPSQEHSNGRAAIGRWKPICIGSVVISWSNIGMVESRSRCCNGVPHLDQHRRMT